MGRCQGLWTDPVTGISYARARWYDARNASWLSEDPLLDVDSPNLYSFVGQRPHSAKDPMGRAAFFFEGTWNYTSPYGHLSADEESTNIHKLYSASLDKHRRYFGGIGNEIEYDWIEQKLGGLTGYGGKSILRRALWQATLIANKGDTTFDLVGFSRGGPLVLEFTHLLGGGLPRLDDDGNPTGEIIRVNIRFVGLFDAVASFGVPGDDSNPGYRLSLSALARRGSAVHLVAMHETRTLFPVEDVEGAEQIGMPGVHSNVGGGYKNTRLSDLALQRMLQEARAAGVEFDPRYDRAVGNPRTCPEINANWYNENEARQLPENLAVAYPEWMRWIQGHCDASPSSVYWPTAPANTAPNEMLP